MTVRAEIECDAYGCSNSQTLDDSALEGIGVKIPNGWHEHDLFHYCGSCWPEVKKEIDGDA